MPIVVGELLRYLSDVKSDAGTNGGRMSSVQIVSGVKNNLFPQIPQDELTAGVAARYRKHFIKVANDDDLPLNTTRIWMSEFTAGDDRVFIFPGTQRDVQSNLTGSERVYGAGNLNANVSAGGTTLDVALETGAGADEPFKDGDTVYISDGTNSEFITLESPGGVSYSVDLVTLTLDSPTTLQNGYLAATPTRVSAVIEAGTVETILDNVVETTTSGTFDENSVTLDNIGTVEQTWTLTFSDSLNFSVVGDVLGSVGSGDISTQFAPNNPDFTKPYFTIPTAVWGGTWANGETVVWQTHPAAYPLWAIQIIPAGSGSLSGNNPVYTLDGAG